MIFVTQNKKLYKINKWKRKVKKSVKLHKNFNAEIKRLQLEHTHTHLGEQEIITVKCEELKNKIEELDEWIA